MSAFMPTWHAFDASHSVRVLSERPRGGGVVALCVSPGLAAGSDGPRLALALARRWVEQGRPVVLADGSLGRPTLHRLVGVENAEGLAEILLAGVEWEAVAVPSGTPGLKLIPAGGHSAPSAAEDVAHRLGRLCAEVTGEGLTLALAVPLGSMVAEWAIDASTDIVVLASPHEETVHFFALDEDRIRAVVGPPGRATPLKEESPAPSVAEPPRPTTSEPQAPPPKVEDAGADRPPPRWDADEGFLPPRDQPGSAEGGRRGAKSKEAVVEDKWAEAAARLRATKEMAGGTSAEAPAEEPAPPPAHEPPVVHAELPGLEAAASPQEGRPAPYPARGDEEAEVLPEAPPFPELPEESLPRQGHTPRVPRTIPETFSPAGAPVDREDDAELPAWLSEESPVRRRRGVQAGRWWSAAAAVVVVVGGGWIWMNLRSRPPLEPTGVMPPRAAVSSGPPLDAPVEAGDPRAVGAEAEATPDAPPPAAEGAAADVAAGDPAEATAPVEEAAVAPAPADAPFQRYSWALAALGSYEAAASLAERAGRRAPDEPFVVVPIETNGRILYRVLGGAREDRQALQDTRGAIAQAAGIGAEAPFARQAGLAFALGDFPRRQDAVDRAGALRGQGVWGYVLQLGAEGSSGAFRVYAGAYESETEARPLLARLRQAGIPDPALMERRGRVVR